MLSVIQQAVLWISSDRQNLGTTRPIGRLLFLTGAFAEFERSIIKQRV